VLDGFKPDYATQFSFKNKTDDQYINYLKTKSIRVEIFLLKAQKAEAIAFAEITLLELLETDDKLTDGSKSIVHHNKVSVFSSKDTTKRLGQIKYKLRMRKSLKAALKWYKEHIELDSLPHRMDPHEEAR
jgi:hypothetical protein